MALPSFVGSWWSFSYLILYKVGRTPWMGDQPAEKTLSTHRTTRTQNKRTHTYTHTLASSGIEPTIQAFEREKTVHALDGRATVIGDNSRKEG
jgi:hypothetical protein